LYNLLAGGGTSSASVIERLRRSRPADAVSPEITGGALDRHHTLSQGDHIKIAAAATGIVEVAVRRAPVRARRQRT
jgi:hypothetical protein